ncbi:MAG: hypothetical protein Q27BB25_19035 [Blastomonas sp. CACIA14H2]|uniref:hypothetical protein n=1 Tax=Blastomonas sp. CACIA14H2 TaxID=1419876 RepID=UPI0003CFBEA4|nr:MAG: hypothetical protein Q27BB25_19035 [Blastomonas sp. CACIA14H2]
MKPISLRLLGVTMMASALAACGGEKAAEAPAEGEATAEVAPAAQGPLWAVSAEEGKTVMSLVEGADKTLATLKCANGSKTVEFEVPGFARIPEEIALTLAPDGGEPVLSIMVPAGGDGFASGSAPLPDNFKAAFAGKQVLSFGMNTINVDTPAEGEADTFVTFCAQGESEG